MEGQRDDEVKHEKFFHERFIDKDKYHQTQSQPERQKNPPTPNKPQIDTWDRYDERQRKRRSQ